MFTSEELRDEALRLVQLDQNGLAVESVALALRIGDGSSRAAQVLHDLDVVTVEHIFNGRAPVRDGQADVGDTEQ